MILFCFDKSFYIFILKKNQIGYLLIFYICIGFIFINLDNIVNNLYNAWNVKEHLGSPSNNLMIFNTIHKLVGWSDL